MPEAVKRVWRLGTALSVLSCMLGVVPRAHAASPPLDAELTCAKIAAPGRIVCELRASSATGKLVWADALVVSSPAFARPLRSRVVMQLSPDASAAAKLALVGSGKGTGELVVNVRGVVCQPSPNGEICTPELRRVSCEVEVGASPNLLAP